MEREAAKKVLFLVVRSLRGGGGFVKEIYSFHFTTKVSKQKMSAGTIHIDKIIFSFFCNIFKIGKIRAIFDFFIFYDVNLTATVAKFPTFFNFFFTKIVSLVHTCPGPFDL